MGLSSHGTLHSPCLTGFLLLHLLFLRCSRSAGCQARRTWFYSDHLIHYIYSVRERAHTSPFKFYENVLKLWVDPAARYIRRSIICSVLNKLRSSFITNAMQILMHVRVDVVLESGSLLCVARWKNIALCLAEELEEIYLRTVNLHSCLSQDRMISK